MSISKVGLLAGRESSADWEDAMGYIPFSVGAPVGRRLSCALLVCGCDRAVESPIFGVVPDEAMTTHADRWAIQDGYLVAYLYDPTRERHMEKPPIVFDGC